MNIDGTVAITGAGAGLGLGFAVEFARRGCKVLALILDESQRADVAAATEGLTGSIEVQILDVTKPGDFAFPDDLDVLVNNAGVCFKNLPIEAIPIDEWRTYFEVNLFGAVALTQRAIPVMRARGRGTICNISSGSVHKPMPFLGPYRATKWALSAFSETLRTEVAPFGIRVLEFMPGAVNTGIMERSAIRRIAEAAELPLYAPMAHRQRALFAAAGVVPVEILVAAAYMVDAVENDGGRMRHGSCPGSHAAIDAWRPAGGEEGIAAFVAAMCRA